MPDPDIADFKPGFLQIGGKPMRHIWETEHGDMRTGFQHPKQFYPDKPVWKDQIPANTPHPLSVGRIDDTTIDAVVGHPRQSVESIVSNQVGFERLGRRRGGWRLIREAGRRLSGVCQDFVDFQCVGSGHRMSFFQLGLPMCGWRSEKKHPVKTIYEKKISPLLRGRPMHCPDIGIPAGHPLER